MKARGKWLTIREASDISGAAKSTLTKWCRTGKLPNARKIETPLGSYWEIAESDLKNIDEIKVGRPRKQ
ncbi:MAG TPA: helix-turn-helix domain-containing protein [Pyrinomonadaceae bacterium]|nr:helix-turn-helix domain-containing protein [Pyrinomonadaceae bacterium]